MSLDIMGGKDDPTAEPARAKRSRKGLWITLSILGVIIALVVGLGLFYLATINSALSSVQRDKTLNPPTYENRPPAAEVKNEALNIMLLGSDSRGEGDRGRSDTIMWMHVSGDRKGIYLTSFTRDMWVDIPNHGKGKINWAYAFGGAPLQVQTVETLVGARIDHVAVIDFEGFIKLTEVLGGVTVNNRHASSSSKYNFPKGEITISGAEALWYVRERKNLPDGAWSRAERQRDVVSAIIQKVLSPSVVANPVTFSKLASEAARTVKVDSGVTNKLVYDTALGMSLDGAKSIHSIQAPNKGQGMVGDQAVDFPDFEQLKELGAALRNDTMDDYLAKHPK